MNFPLQDYWSHLREGTRDQIIGGLFVTLVGALIAVFWKVILRGIKKLVAIVDPPPAQAAPQPVVVKVETVQPPPPEPPPTAPPPRPVPRSQIPRPPIAGFVARRDESGREIVERLKEELAPAKDQLIVLWGAGGVGKTTLAAETARAMRTIFDGGIVWTSADGKPDFSLSTLLDDIATHLGHPEFRQLAPAAKDQEVHDALLQAPNTLIVLDNFETVSPEEQEKCAGWLATQAPCPALITSRDEVRHARPVHILAMSESEAQEFLQRLISEAHNQRAFEQLDHEQIIKAADRIPLVLQWVVKQIDSARQPLAVLDELSHGEGDAAKRVFDRSFDLAQVGDDGRAVLLALSLFVPDASRPILTVVAGFENDQKRLETALEQLIELWLIQTSENNERVRVEGLTRELSKARLMKDPSVNHYRGRFVNILCNYAQEYAKNTPENYEALEKEKDNLLNSLGIAFDLEDWQSVFVLARVIGSTVKGVLSLHGHWTEVIKVNEQALEAARRTESPYKIAHFTYNLAVIYGYRGELEKARLFCNECQEIAEGLKERKSLSSIYHQSAILYQYEGNLIEARRLHNASLEIEREFGNQEGIAQSLHQLGNLARKENKPAEASRLYNESLKINRGLQQPDLRTLAASLHQLAILAHQKGDRTEAHKLYNESLELERKLGNQLGIAISLYALGLLAEDETNYVEAARLFREAWEISHRLESPDAKEQKEAWQRVEAKTFPK